MKKKSIRHFLANFACVFVYSKDRRKKLRVVLNSPMIKYIRFIRRDTGLRAPRLRTFVGYQARSLIIAADNRWVYKFPLRRDNYKELAMREYRIVRALKPFMTIPTPGVRLIRLDDIIVRKYRFVRGATLRGTPVDVILANLDTLAKQVAQFLYTVGCADPDEIRDLKPDANAAPGYLYGWCQRDICDNFMIDLKTMRVTFFIDWEDAEFGDFSVVFRWDKRTPNRQFMAAVRAEYDRLWVAAHGSLPTD